MLPAVETDNRLGKSQSLSRQLTSNTVLISAEPLGPMTVHLVLEQTYTLIITILCMYLPPLVLKARHLIISGSRSAFCWD